jgi:hypothetical protein
MDYWQEAQARAGTQEGKGHKSGARRNTPSWENTPSQARGLLKHPQVGRKKMNGGTELQCLHTEFQRTLRIRGVSRARPCGWGRNKRNSLARLALTKLENRGSKTLSSDYHFVIFTINSLKKETKTTKK